MNLRDFSTATIDELEARVRVSYARLNVVSELTGLLPYAYSSRPGFGLNPVVEVVPRGVVLAITVIDRYSAVSSECSAASQLVLRWNSASFSECSAASQLVLRWNSASFMDRLFDAELI